jgi:predicted transposase YdaD
MKLSEMYQQLLEEIKQEGRQEGEQKGRQEGRQEGELLGIDRGIQTERRAMVESILQVRFGEIDSQLATIIDQVIAMTREEFTPMLLQLSREELLVKFTP